MSISKALFPAGHIVTQRIHSLRELDLHTWKLDRVQLGRGSFYSHLDVFHTHSVQLGITHRSIRIAVEGDAPLDTISFFIIINDASIIQQKQKMTKRHLAILEYGGEIDAVFVEPISFISIAINQEIFKEKYEQKFHEVYSAVEKFDLRLCNSEVLDLVSETLTSILKAVNSNRAFFLEPQNMIMIENIIIEQVLNAVHASSCEETELKWVETAHSLFELIKIRYKEDINIEMLCKELKLSQRNAYLTFQKHYGMTPKQYLLSIRLGKIKQALEQADPKTVKIEHFAFKNGFYHMSHFAKIYKSFFGELPSQTLWKHKN